MEPPLGFEPRTYCLQNSCSAAELRWHYLYGGQARICTLEGVSQQIYSLPRLTTSVPALFFKADAPPQMRGYHAPQMRGTN